MALGGSVREMMLLITAENRAGGALRSVARDLGSVSKMQQAHMAQQRLAVKANALENQQLAAQSKLRNLTSGTAALNLMKQRVALTEKSARLEREVSTNLKAQALQQDRIAAAMKRRGAMGVAGNSLQVRSLQLQMERLQNTEARLNFETKTLTAANERLTASERVLGVQVAATNRELSLIGTRLAALRHEQAALNKEVRAMRWDPLIKGGNILTHMARPVQYAGIVMGAGLAYAASQAAKFNTEATLAATQVSNKFGKGAATVQVASRQIQKGILGIMSGGKATASPTEQNAAAYDIFSSLTLNPNQGKAVKEGMQLLDQFNKASIAGQTNLQEIAHAGISVLQNFGRQGHAVQDMPGLFQKMFAAVRFGRMTFAQFVSTLNQTVPSFRAAGLKFDDLTSSLAALTRYMPSSRMAGTSLARMIEMFGRKDFVEGLKKSGVHITDIHGRLIPMLDIFEKINKRFPNLKKFGGQELLNFFKTITALGSGKAGTTGTIQGARAFRLLLLNLADYRDIVPKVVNDNYEFTKSFQALQHTPQVQWREFVSQLHAFFITIGMQVIPVLAKLGKPLMQALHWFKSLGEGTQKTFAKWATYSAVAMILGSALLFIVGTVFKLVGIIGKAGIALPVVFLAFAGYATTTAYLKGNIHDLNDVMLTLVGIFTNHGVWGWVGYFALASYGVTKLTRSLMGLRGAMAVNALSGGAAGGGGLLSKIGSFGSYAKTGYQVSRLEGAGVAAASLAGMGAAVSSIGIALPVIGGLIIAGAGGLLLWQHHMQAVARHAAEVRTEMQRIDNFNIRERTQGAKLAGIGGGVEGVLRSQKALADAQKQLRQDRKSRAGKSIITSDLLDIADAQNTLYTANSKANQGYGSLNRMLREHALLLANIGEKAKERQRLPLIGLLTGGLMGANKEGQRIRDLNLEIKRLSANSRISAGIITHSFGAAITSLQRIGPAIGIGKISASARSDLLRLSLKQGQFPTISQIKTVIKAEVDKASLRKASADIRNAINAGQAQRNLAAGKGSVLTQQIAGKPAGLFDVVGLLTSQLPKAHAAATKIHHNVATIFAKHIRQPIDLGPVNPKAAVLGARIDQGIARGVSENQSLIDNAVVAAVNAGIAAAKGHKGLVSHSPSRKAAEELGKPFVQGISVGIMENLGLLAKPVAQTIDTIFSTMQDRMKQQVNIFQSTFLTNRISAITDPLKLARAEHTLTTATTALHRKKGNTVANQQRVAIAQANLKKLGGGKALTFGDIQKDMNIQLKDLKTFNNSMQSLEKRGAPKDLLDALGAAGPTNVKEITKLASGSSAQLKQYFRIWRETRLATDKLSALSSSDVFKAVRSQEKLYAAFNKNISALVRKHVPRTLIDELRAAGIGSEKQLVAINKMTGRELSNFVVLWKKFKKQSLLAATPTKADIATSVKAGYDQIFSYLTNMFQTLKSQNVSAFGNLFGGTTPLQSLISQNSGLGSMLQGFMGSPFEGVSTSANKLLDNINLKLQYGGKLNAKDLQSVLDQQVNTFQDWQKDIQKLIDKGLPSDLISQLEQLGPSAKQYLDVLVSETDTELQKWVARWNEGQASIKDATDKLKIAIDPQLVIDDLAAQTRAFQEWAGDIETLRARGLPEQLIQQLQALGPGADSALKALINATQPQLDAYTAQWTAAQNAIQIATQSDFNAQLNAWYAQGINVGLAIIQGTIDITPSVVESFRKLAKSISDGFQANLNLPAVVDPSTYSSGTAATPSGTSGTGYSASDVQQLLNTPGYHLSGGVLYYQSGSGPYGKKPQYAAGGPIAGDFRGTDSRVIEALPGEYMLSRGDVADLKRGLNNPQGGGDFYDIKVYANPDESMMATLNRMFFRIRTSNGRTGRYTP